MLGIVKTATICVVALVASSEAAAEDLENKNALSDGMHSLSFGIPDGGNSNAAGTAGYWVMFGNLNVGFNVGLALDTGTDDTSFDILLAPTVRSYVSTDGVVCPFWFGQVNLRLADNGSDDTQELGVAAGVGAEWFPVPEFSISGQVGLGVDVIRPGDLDPVALGSFTSELSAQIYFDGL